MTAENVRILEELMRMDGISIGELSRRSLVNKATVSLILSGKKPFRVEYMIAFARVFGKDSRQIWPDRPVRVSAPAQVAEVSA